MSMCVDVCMSMHVYVHVYIYIHVDTILEGARAARPSPVAGVAPVRLRERRPSPHARYGHTAELQDGSEQAVASLPRRMRTVGTCRCREEAAPFL